MSKVQTPLRYDYVGSFLRPEKLKQDGSLTKEIWLMRS